MKRIFFMLLPAILIASGLYAQPGVAPVNPPTGGFAVDGYIKRQGAAGDWLLGNSPFNAPQSSAVFFTPGSITDTMTPVHPNPPILTYHAIDRWNDVTNDEIFDGGNKLDQNPNVDWGWRSQKPPAKDEINNALICITEEVATGHTWALIAGDRWATNGTSYLDFEFYQNSVYRTNDTRTGPPVLGGTGKFVSTGPHNGRTIGDLSITLEFTNGGAVFSNISVYRWEPISETAYDYVFVPLDSLPAGTHFGAANPTNGTPSVFGAFGLNNYADSLQFVEAAIDLTELLTAVSSDPCRALIFKTLFIKTKSSAEPTADLKDFIEPIQLELNLGVTTISYPDVCSNAGTVSPTVNDAAPPDQNVSFSIISPAVHPTVTINSTTGVVTVGLVCVQTDYVVRYDYTARPGCDTFALDTFRVSPPPPIVMANAPPNITVACGSIPAPTCLSYTNSGTGSCLISGCVTSTFSATPGPCGGVVTETWAGFTDVCGRAVAGRTRTITVLPATLPVFAAAPNITVACGAIPPPSSLSYTNGLAGNCLISGSATSTQTSPPGVCGGVVTETWSATDVCGRPLASRVRTITVNAAAAPVFAAAPPNITVACGAIPAPTCLSYTNGGTGACLISGCATSTQTTAPGACGGVVTETWSFTDQCGRALTSRVRTITVSPAALPVFAAAPNITVACGAIPPPSSLSYTNGLAGNCLISGSATSTQTSPPGACGGVVTETWNATDACGRALAPRVRTITVNAAAAPVFAAAPPNITVACGAIPAPTCLSYTNGGTGACLISGCATSTQTTAPGACGGVVTETWSFTDQCGRALASRVRTITVSPAALPVFAAAPNITVACGAIPAPSSLSFTNGLAGNCLISGSATSTQTTAPGICGGVVTETWNATDACGRALAPRVRTITVNPAAAPVFAAAPPNITVACGAIPAPTCLSYTNGGTGACLISGCVTSTQTTAPGICGGVVTETWSFTDQCGRALTPRVRTITVLAATAPTFAAAPPNVTVACGAIPAPSSLSYTNGGTGACLISGSVTSTQTSPPGVCGGVITETWSFTDQCGRAITPRVRTITVSPAALPVFAAAPNITVACGAIPAPSCLSYTNSGTGACLISGCVTSTQTTAPGRCGGVVTETWSFTDQCSRNITRVRTITVSPAAPASFVSPPGNIVTTVCGVAPLPSTLNYTNNLGGACNISGTVTSTITGGSPANCGVYTETWSFTDPCGRGVTTHVRTITVPCCGEAICTYTQGAYGSTGGMMCNGEPADPGPNQFNTFDFITNSINNYTINSYTPPLSGVAPFVNQVLVVGKANLNKTVYMSSSAAHVNGIIDMLPGGGPSKELIAGNYPITALPSDYLNQNTGRIGNTLLAQTITLGLNLGIGPNLGNFVLQGGVLVTAEVEYCGSNTPLPRICVYNPAPPYNLLNVINDYEYRTISAAVVAAIPGTPKTVQGLFELANRALANQDGVVGKENNVNLSEIASAVDAINNAFDECRIFIAWNVPPCPAIDPSALVLPGGMPIGGTGDLGSQTDKLTISAFPNPFTDKVRFVVASPITGQGSLEVFNTLGQKVGIVYRGLITAGRGQVYEYNVPPANRANLFYVLRVGDQQVTGKLLNLQH